LSNAFHVPSGWQQVVGPFDDEQFLSAFKGAESFGLGVPVDGVEDPVVPSIFRHDTLLEGWTAGGLSKAACDVAGDGGASNGNGGFRRRDKWDKLGRFRPVVEVVGGTGVGVAVHLGFPRKVFDWRVVILVSFDVETGEFDRETLQDVDDAALQVAFRSHAVVGIVPGPVHGKADAFDEALVVAAEEMLDIFRHLDVKEPKAEFEEEKGGEHAVGFRSTGAGVKTESGSHAGPQDEASDGEFPPERAVVVFGAPITDKVKLERFAAFQKLFEEIDGLF
jgi:hypothetical protein